MPKRPQRPRGYADLSHLHEDIRIDLICRQVLKGDTVGVPLDNNPDKIDRYVAKVKAKLPEATAERCGILSEGVFLLRFSIKNLN